MDDRTVSEVVEQIPAGASRCSTVFDSTRLQLGGELGHDQHGAPAALLLAAQDVAVDVVADVQHLAPVAHLRIEQTDRGQTGVGRLEGSQWVQQEVSEPMDRHRLMRAQSAAQHCRYCVRPEQPSLAAGVPRAVICAPQAYRGGAWRSRLGRPGSAPTRRWRSGGWRPCAPASAAARVSYRRQQRAPTRDQ